MVGHGLYRPAVSKQDREEESVLLRLTDGVLRDSSTSLFRSLGLGGPDASQLFSQGLARRGYCVQ